MHTLGSCDLPKRRPLFFARREQVLVGKSQQNRLFVVSRSHWLYTERLFLSNNHRKSDKMSYNISTLLEAPTQLQPQVNVPHTSLSMLQRPIAAQPRVFQPNQADFNLAVSGNGTSSHPRLLTVYGNGIIQIPDCHTPPLLSHVGSLQQRSSVI